jgi:hypothetical protein
VTRPLTISFNVDYAADTDMLENECKENNRDDGHLGGQETARVRLSLQVLARYAGTYEFREGGAGTFFPRTQTVSLVNGQLFMNALPLIPQLETTFETETAVIEFVMDLGGQVTNFGFERSRWRQPLRSQTLRGLSWSWRQRLELFSGIAKPLAMVPTRFLC